MKELLNSSLYFGVTVSIAGYGIGLFLKRKFKWGFLNPLLLAIIFVIIVLQVFGIDYEVYDVVCFKRLIHHDMSKSLKTYKATKQKGDPHEQTENNRPV